MQSIFYMDGDTRRSMFTNYNLKCKVCHLVLGVIHNKLGFDYEAIESVSI